MRSIESLPVVRCNRKAVFQSSVGSQSSSGARNVWAVAGLYGLWAELWAECVGSGRNLWALGGMFGLWAESVGCGQSCGRNSGQGVNGAFTAEPSHSRGGIVLQMTSQRSRQRIPSRNATAIANPRSTSRCATRAYFCLLLLARSRRLGP
eukprot:9497681-Pyramimonas_sp.AAC.1